MRILNLEAGVLTQQDLPMFRAEDTGTIATASATYQNVLNLAVNLTVPTDITWNFYVECSTQTSLLARAETRMFLDGPTPETLGEVQHTNQALLLFEGQHSGRLFRSLAAGLWTFRIQLRRVGGTPVDTVAVRRMSSIVERVIP